MGSELSKGTGSPGFGILRRFSLRKSGSKGARKSDDFCSKGLSESGLVSKFGKIDLKSYKRDRVSRNNLEYGLESNKSPRRQSTSVVIRARSGHQRRSMDLAFGNVSFGQIGFRFLGSSTRSSANQASSKGRSKIARRSSKSKVSRSGSGVRRLQMVDTEREVYRQDFRTNSDSFYNHRRFGRRLGCSNRESSPLRLLDKRAIQMAHQQERALCSLHRVDKVQEGSLRSVSHASIRQPHCGCLFTQSRRDEINCSAGGDTEDFVFSSKTAGDYSRVLHSRSLQFDRRLSFEKQDPARLAFTARNQEQDLPKVGYSSDRSFCVKSVKGSSSLRIIRSRRSPGVLHERVQSSLALSPSVVVSTTSSHTQGTSASEQVIRDVPDSGSTVGEGLLEERSQTQGAGGALPNLRREQTSSRSFNESTPAEGRGFLFRGLESTGWGDLVLGLEGEDIDLVQAAWRDSTWRTYESAWKQWVAWCKSKGVYPGSAQPQQLVAYLSYLSRVRGLALQTILVHKSVIATLADPGREKLLSSHPLVTATIKAIGIRRSMSSKSRLTIWNVQDLIEWLRSNIPDKSSIYQVSRHVAFLLLLASGRRIHDLTLLCVDSEHCERSESSITFWPMFGSKTDNMRFRQSGWHLSSSGDPVLDLVAWVNCLIDLSENRRRARECLFNLFITTRGEVKAASRTVIAGWLKATFKDLGIESGPGSIRSAVASNDFQHDVPLDSILARGNWRGSKNFFKHYCKMVDRARGENVNVLGNSFSVV